MTGDARQPLLAEAVAPLTFERYVEQLKQTDRSIQVRRLRPTPPRPEPRQPAAVTLPDGKHFGFVRHFDGQAIG